MTLTDLDRVTVAALRAGLDAGEVTSRAIVEAHLILGKTNLSELANFLTENMPSGYSSLGGQVLNPYDTSITPGGPDPHQLACHEQALAALVTAGAELTDVTLPSVSRDDELTVLHYEWGPGIDRYPAALGSGAPLRSLAEIQAWNQAHSKTALKFGQMHVDTAVAIDHERDHDAYGEARERDLRATTEGLLAALGEDLECLVVPRSEDCTWAARAGWPSIVIPAGYTANTRRPVGTMLVSRPWTDARLLALAYAFEQVHPVRPPAEINPAAFRRL